MIKVDLLSFFMSETGKWNKSSTFQTGILVCEYLLNFVNLLTMLCCSCVYRPFPLGSSCWGRTDPLQKINKKYVFETGAKKVRRKVDKMQDVSCQGRGLPHSCCLLVKYNFSTIWFIIIRHSREGRLLIGDEICT